MHPAVAHHGGDLEAGGAVHGLLVLHGHREGDDPPVALGDHRLLVGEVALLDVLEDYLPPVPGVGVNPPLVEPREADARGPEVLGRLRDDLRRLLLRSLPPGDSLGLQGHAQGAPGVEPRALGVGFPGEGLVHPCGGVEGVVDQGVAGEALVDPLGLVLVAPEVHDPPGPLEAPPEGGVPLVKPAVGVLDGVVLVEAAGLCHGGDLFLCGRRRLKKTVLRTLE